MKYKIQVRVLNITNYPLVAKHLEEMASQGWLIHRVVSENLFIYRRIEPEELDFSISPYEIETAFTKKTKEELREFQSVCKSAGWNFATKSEDLHIYYKEKESEAVDLETDDEVRFSTIEKIAKRRLIGMYIIALLGVFVSYVMFFDRIASVDLMRDGLMQVLPPLFPILLILSIAQIIKMKKFLKINKKNVEMGEEIEFEDSKFYLEKTVYILITIMSISFIVYAVYTGFILKNNDTLIFTLPGILGLSIASIFRILAKPSRRDSANKKIWFFIGFIIILLMVPLFNGFKMEQIIRGYNNLDPNNFKILTPDTFGEEEKVYFELEGKVLQDISFIVPKSYSYHYANEEGQDVKTEYSLALNENLAKTLVNQYIKRAKEDSNRYAWSPEFSLEEDKENRWNLDEVYYLNNKKTEIVLRDGKEVFYLKDKDFSDLDIIEIVKKRLEL